MRTKTVLVVSHNQELADVRKKSLEGAGYRVIPANNILSIRDACEDSIDLVLIGYSLPPSEKRRAVFEARNSCKAPVLVLFEGDEPDLDGERWLHLSSSSRDIVEAVRSILNDISSKPKNAKQ